MHRDQKLFIGVIADNLTIMQKRKVLIKKMKKKFRKTLEKKVLKKKPFKKNFFTVNFKHF